MSAVHLNAIVAPGSVLRRLGWRAGETEKSRVDAVIRINDAS